MDVFYTTVTQKGQITIPKPFRDMLGLTRNSQVKIEKRKNSLALSTDKSILALSGILNKQSFKQSNHSSGNKYIFDNIRCCWCYTTN